MSDWVRVTHDCTFEGLPPEMTAAIDKHVEQHNLGLIGSQAAACIETTSKKTRKGVFEPGDKRVVTGVLLLPGWLLWVIQGDDMRTTVMSARLADVTVQDYAATPFASMVPDCGVEISGSFTDMTERTSSFVGLDDGAAARRFKQMLIQAVQAAQR